MKVDKGTKVLSRDGKDTGLATGSTHRCQLEGCTGIRVTVKWPEGNVTHPCSKGMETRNDGSLKLV